MSAALGTPPPASAAAATSSVAPAAAAFSSLNSQSGSPAASASAAIAPGPDLIYTQRIPRKKSAFRDRVRVHVSGGRGGSGCSSYDTDPYGKGGPDGANGGRGGDVYLVSTDSLSSFALESFHLRAHNGHAGGSQLSKGRNGYSLKVPIPSGTIVSEILDSDPVRGEFRLRFLADLDRSGLEIKVASGGAGGLGNRAFRTQYRKQSRFSTVGNYGSAKWLYLELKCIADVGLVGFPNAGKSSLLAAISNATPLIANYPFTTLAPQIGVVEEGGVLAADHSSKAVDASSPAVSAAASSSSSAAATTDPASSASATERDPLGAPLSHAASRMSRIRVADLPGLISGAASHNRGLGHEFLKHIQRTRVLCYVLDISGADGRDPVSDFVALQQELHTFDPTLLARPAIILANKTDNLGAPGAFVRSKAEMQRKIDELSSVTSLPVLLTSCLRRTGLSPVVSRLFEMVGVQAQREAEDRMAGARELAERQRSMQEQLSEQQLRDAEQERRDQENEAAHAAKQASSSATAATATKPKKPKRLTKKQLAAAAALAAADANAQS